MANILILTLVFPPDNVSTAHIMGDLAADLRGYGHSVTVLTTAPHYNHDAEAERAQPIRRLWGPLLGKSGYQGIQVFHTRMPKKGSNVFLRLAAWVGFHKLSILAGLTIVPKADIIIAPSPPLTIGAVAWLIGCLRGSRFVYNIQEIYPDIAIRLGALKNPSIIRLLCRLEGFVYGRAAKITVITPSMQHNLLGKGVPPSKIEIVPNFVDMVDMRPLPKDNPFSRNHGIHDKFVVSYAGNMGVPQGLEIILEAARLLKQEKRITFMMIGDGMQRKPLRRRSETLGLDNLIFLPHQPYSRVAQIYSASDANLVPQTREAGFDAIPSKVYRIMACGRPVIAVTDAASDLARLVTDSGCGFVVRPNSSQELAAAVVRAFSDRDNWLDRGVAGRAYVSERYTRKAVTSRYDRIVRELLA